MKNLSFFSSSAVEMTLRILFNYIFLFLCKLKEKLEEHLTFFLLEKKDFQEKRLATFTTASFRDLDLR
jgi:hypothetical protein